MSGTVIVDCGSGNIRSVARACAVVAARGAVRGAAAVPGPVTVSAEPACIAGADRIILPGQGAFAACRASLDAMTGLLPALVETVMTRRRPFLGICVGMQLMADRGFEHGVTAGLGWIPGEVRPLDRANGLPVPHMGWNRLYFDPAVHPVLHDLGPEPHAYFAHGYAFWPARPAQDLASVVHGGTLAAVVGRDNLLGTQFHPEKSQRVGLRLLENFLRWQP